MEKFDIVIIGAGVVGLAISKSVALNSRKVLILEKNSSFGQETSSRNSEVIHGGMYYPASTLKIKMCVEGRRLLYEICDKYKIPYRKIGKLIVAVAKDEIVALEKLFIQGKNNGVENLKILEKIELKQMEPNISGISALFSSDTGIIDSHLLMAHYLDSAKDKGAMIAYMSEVVEIKKKQNEYAISVDNNGEKITLHTKVVINSAGLNADNIAALAGIDIKKFNYELYYCKGQYFRVHNGKNKKISRLIYPIPKPKSGGLGVHATLDLAGNLKLGPDDEYLNNRDKNYSVDSSRRVNFYNSAKIFLPFIEETDLRADTSGIRPKLQGPTDGFRDFIIKDEVDKGYPGLINLIGIESPGLTASPAIALFIKNLVENILN